MTVQAATLHNIQHQLCQQQVSLLGEQSAIALCGTHWRDGLCVLVQ